MNPRTRIFLLIGVFLGIVCVGWFFTMRPVEAPQGACTMDARICPDGSAVGREGPNCEFAPCPVTSLATSTTHRDLIKVTQPLPGTTLTSPITITGMARGTWFFEASFPIIVVNWDGLIIGEGIAQANGDWMTEEYVPFSATITYTLPEETPYMRGALILKKDNPSGLPEYDDAFEIPVMLTPTSSEKTYTPPPHDTTYIPPTKGSAGVACTMDVKECPDGTYVGRIAPNCAFAPCTGIDE